MMRSKQKSSKGLFGSSFLQIERITQSPNKTYTELPDSKGNDDCYRQALWVLCGLKLTQKGEEMKESEAKAKICPYINGNCITSNCMMWATTVDGKKEVARKKIPYDIYPYDEGRLRSQLKEDGYEEVKLNGEWRSTYIKYEEAHEGYCQIVKDNQ